VSIGYEGKTIDDLVAQHLARDAHARGASVTQKI